MFESNNPESTSAIVRLKGNPLNYVISLQSKYYSATQKRLNKGEAIMRLLNKIPKDVVENSIKQIIQELKQSVVDNYKKK